MGSLCSRQSNYEGGHTVLGAADSTRPDNPRAAALLAAEARLDASKKRGTPNQGPLAKAANAPTRREPEQQEEQRLVWD
ncbi:hypothetical protein C8F01DRAFT_1108701 [Mycena amicta]|nr:hypothetical protein C8F01DRAFT_1108701 [Mycena amicta]